MTQYSMIKHKREIMNNYNMKKYMTKSWGDWGGEIQILSKYF